MLLLSLLQLAIVCVCVFFKLKLNKLWINLDKHFAL